MAPLTKETLTQHNLLMSKQKIDTAESHAAKVVQWEKIHQTIHQSGDTMGHKIVLDNDPVDDTAFKHTNPQESVSFCNFELPTLPDQPSNEGPLERFFTPDGVSDPYCFSQNALGTQFANENSVEARRLHTEMCVEIIVRNENANKGSTHA